MSPNKSLRSHYCGCVTSFIAHPGNSRVGSLCSVYMRRSMAMQGPHVQQEPPGSSGTSSQPRLSTAPHLQHLCMAHETPQSWPVGQSAEEWALSERAGKGFQRVCQPLPEAGSRAYTGQEAATGAGQGDTKSCVHTHDHYYSFLTETAVFSGASWVGPQKWGS